MQFCFSFFRCSIFLLFFSVFCGCSGCIVLCVSPVEFIPTSHLSNLNLINTMCPVGLQVRSHNNRQVVAYKRTCSAFNSYPLTHTQLTESLLQFLLFISWLAQAAKEKGVKVHSAWFKWPTLKPLQYINHFHSLNGCLSAFGFRFSPLLFNFSFTGGNWFFFMLFLF